MAKDDKRPLPVADLGQWGVGTRVIRKTSDDLGTVAETNGKVKVKWDNGQTSYFNHGKPSNVKLEPES